MADFSGIWVSLNDKCWPLLEKLRLDGIFERFNLPPLLFPLAIIIIIILLALSLSGPGAPAPSCGDNICGADEDSTICPYDCPSPPPATKKLTINFDRSPECQLTVKLSDSNGVSKGSQRSSNRMVEFDGVDFNSFSLAIEGPYGQVQTTSTLDFSESAIDVILLSNICQTPVAPQGTLRLSIKDAATNLPLNGVSISIAETQGGQIIEYKYRDQLVNNFRDFTVPHSKTYTIYATKQGYNAKSEDVFVSAGQPTSKSISLELSQPAAPATGDLEVCVKNGTESVNEGLIMVQELSGGNYAVTGDLSNVDPTTEPTFSGCYVFNNIPSGKVVTASVTGAPSGCIPAVADPPSLAIQGGQRSLIEVSLNCTTAEQAYLKIKVIGHDGEVLTQNATITLWTAEASLVPGTGIANSLSIGSGGYTEEVTVSSHVPLYAWVRGLPSGYLDYKSLTFSLIGGEHRALDITLNYTDPMQYSSNFTFSGVSVPRYLSKGQVFTAMVNSILFGSTVLNDNTATVTASVGGIDCTTTYTNFWSFGCKAPAQTGEYNLVIRAEYNNRFGTYSLPVEVREYSGNLTALVITPILGAHGEPPLTLYYDITLNGVPISSLTDQNMDLVYIDSPDAYPGNATMLSYDAERGYWKLAADVPYKGDYQMEMFVETSSNGLFYNTTNTVGFTATSNSEYLRANVYVSSSILGLHETFEVEVELEFRDRTAYGLDIFELYLDGVFHTLLWDDVTRIYRLTLSTSSQESCSDKIRFLIQDEEVTSPMEIYVIDTSGSRTGSCPLSRSGACSDIEEVRKCFIDYKSRTAAYSSAQITTCVKAGCGSNPLRECPTTNKGDLDLSCQIGESDIEMFSEYLQTVTSPADRDSLAECLDMDNDGDVDDDDLTCLNNMEALKWYGDSQGDYSGNNCTEYSMHGGFCFDIDVDSQVPGDVYKDVKINSEDEAIMSKIIAAAAAGVTPAQDLLDIADFNQDGRINYIDMDCLKRFFVVDFETGDVIPTETPIPVSCFNIFNLDCNNFRGDLNIDGVISLTDLIIMRFIVDGVLQIQSNMTPCADIDNNDLVNEYDLQCLESYFTDQEYWLACLGCENNLPEAAVYPVEICNDGWDNDCDGLRDDEDPRCDCSAATPCAMRWDSDGGTVIGINDSNYKICADLGEGYGWHTPTEINESCNESSQWNTTYMCGGDTLYTCVYLYESGFKYPNTATGNGSFGWLEGNGNIGPLGVTSDCDDEDFPSCASGWFSVGTSEGEECGSDWDKYCDGQYKHCRNCRFDYDFCRSLTCASSGETLNETVSHDYSVCRGITGGAGEAACILSGSLSAYLVCQDTHTYIGPASGWCDTSYAETCPSAGACMGLWNTTSSSD